MHFDDTTRLRHADGLAVRLNSGGEFEVTCGSGWARTGPHTLLVLSAFTSPRSANDAIAWLGPHFTGPQAAIEYMDTVVALVRRRALLPYDNDVCPGPNSEAGWFGVSPIHIAMLSDEARTGAWLRAIRGVVKPEDVVVDLGTGTGVLAIAAAQAGARKVYAIESTRIAETAERMAAANGVADRVQVIHGWSTQIEIPEPADVLISEILGHDPFEEHVLQLTADAARRFLRPNARFVPKRIRLSATLVNVPETDVRTWAVSPELATRFEELYRMDFRQLAICNRPKVHYAHHDKARRWQRLTRSGLLLEVSLGGDVPAQVFGGTELVSLCDSACNAVLLHFDVEVEPDVWVSTAVQNEDSAVHWKLPVYLIPERKVIAAGQRVNVSYGYAGRPRLDVDW